MPHEHGSAGAGWAVLDLALAFMTGLVIGLLLAALDKGRPKPAPEVTEH